MSKAAFIAQSDAHFGKTCWAEEYNAKVDVKDQTHRVRRLWAIVLMNREIRVIVVDASEVMQGLSRWLHFVNKINHRGVNLQKGIESIPLKLKFSDDEYVRNSSVGTSDHTESTSTPSTSPAANCHKSFPQTEDT